MRNKIVMLLVCVFTLACSTTTQEQPPQEKKEGTCLKGNCRYGVGVYLYPNGDRYEGEFRSGVPFGYGTMYYKKINKSLTGRWKWGRPDVSR